MKITIRFMKSFTQDVLEGNPTAVVLDANELSSAQMLNIAENLGFSETVFVQKSLVADFKVRFFAPKQEVNLCGHGTIACFHLLMALEKISFIDDFCIYTQETKAGILPVRCYRNGLIEMEQVDYSYNNYKPVKEDIAKILNISIEQILDYPLSIVSTGTPKLIIPINSLETLLKMKPNFEAIKNYCELSGARGFYPFTFETLNIFADFHARQFNPLSGIDEDPVTGVAAGALGAYMKHNKIITKKEFIVEQGFVLEKPGKIYVSVDDKILVGGYAVEIKQEDIAISNIA